MRRSRSALLLFLTTFSASLLAVGLADGRHQSAGSSVDFHRFVLDEVTDTCTWKCPCDFAPPPQAAICPEEAPAAVTVVEQNETNPAVECPLGSTGWLVLMVPSSPFGLVLYIDDETACSLACPEVTNWPADGEANWGCGAADPVAADEYVTADEDVVAAEVETINAADQAIDILAAWNDPFVAPVIWPAVVEVENVRLSAWIDGNDWNAYPDCSLTGWVDDANFWATAEVWRTIGRAAYDLADRLLRAGDLAAHLASGQIVALLPRTSVPAARAAAGPAEQDGQTQETERQDFETFLSL